MFLFQKRVEIEVYVALFQGLIGAVPRGGKGKRREEHEVFMVSGENVFFDVLRALEEDDKARLLENIEGCSEITMKLLNSALSETQQKELSELSEGL